jgi:hypothetical protein
MKNNYFLKPITALCIVTLLSSTVGIAQCNSFVKKQCMPKIQPFTNNGQMNTSTLSSGQSSSLNMTFYSGQDYRILVCSQEVLGTVTFKILDMSHKVVFDSKENDSPDFWDFKVKSTQQFIVEVSVPPSDSPNSIPPSGCVSVMVGFKKD